MLVAGNPSNSGPQRQGQGSSLRISTVRCVHCRATRVRCDKVKPSCGACLRRKKQCLYVGDRSSPSEPPSSPTSSSSSSSSSSKPQTMPVIRELCFVGQRFGTREIFFLNTYMSEYSPIMRSPMPVIAQAIARTSLDKRSTLSTVMTPAQAAAHASAWAAICVGSILQKSEDVDVYFGNAMEAARLCYDMPSLETLTAMAAIFVAANFAGKFSVVSLVGGYIEVLSAELPPNIVTDVQVRYISGMMCLTTSGQMSFRVHKDRQIAREALTPIQHLSFTAFDSLSTAILVAPIHGPLPPKQLALVKEEIRKIEIALLDVMENRVTGDHFEIHMVLCLLFFLCARAGEILKLVPLATQILNLSFDHPLLLNKPVWRSFAIPFSKFLLRCGEVDTARRMSDYLNRFGPSGIDVLEPLQVADEPAGICVDTAVSAEGFFTLTFIQKLTE